MKVITERDLREQLRGSTSDCFVLPEDATLTPSARDYLTQRKMKITAAALPTAAAPAPAAAVVQEPVVRAHKPKYVGYNTGAFYEEKPEHMTQLTGNRLVAKDHPRIAFRGKLDSLQAMVVLYQALLAEGKRNRLVEDLDDIGRQLGLVMRCDVMEEPLESSHIIGLTHQELRERSHHPMQFFKIRQLLLANYTMGKEYAMLNQIRAAIREAEVAATAAFRVGECYHRMDLIQHLNRLSSALHIMSCMYLAGMYEH